MRDIPARVAALRALGDASAQALARDLALALRDHARVTDRPRSAHWTYLTS